MPRSRKTAEERRDLLPGTAFSSSSKMLGGIEKLKGSSTYILVISRMGSPEIILRKEELNSSDESGAYREAVKRCKKLTGDIRIVA